jgi:xylulokinase
VEATGSVPVASFTITKLRWLAEREPARAARVAAVCLPHDWLSWRLAGHGPGGDLAALATDRSDASGTGYWSPFDQDYRHDLLERALGRRCLLPRVLGPLETALATPAGQVIAPGAGDNAAAALGLGMGRGDVSVSLGTSGVVAALAAAPVADPSGLVAGFADAAGGYLPLACTLNGSRVLDATRTVLGVGHERLSELALSAPAGADGLTLVPYLEGERTPNRPGATGALHGLRLATMDPPHLARAAVEGVLCLMADAMAAIEGLGVPVERVALIGGGARSQAIRELAPAILGHPVTVPPDGEYVAEGAARQAAAVLLGEWPTWPRAGAKVYQGAPTPQVRAQYAEAREHVIDRPA